MPLSLHIVVSFDRRAGGMLAARRPREMRDRDAAERRARTTAGRHDGVLPFSGSRDPIMGGFVWAKMIVAFDVSTDALGA